MPQHGAPVSQRQERRGVMDGRERELRRHTERLAADDAGIARAAELLRGGRLVAFPTETVYGLGADARREDAVEAIYVAKGRPDHNPLIVHVDSLDAARQLGEFPEAALNLVQNGWPRALTLVVPLREGHGLAWRVTAGLTSVALRVPDAPVALRLLKAFGGPIAAPSANPSGRISPTSAAHVLAGLDGRIDAVLDGGSTEAGLESSIVSFLGDGPEVLREGTALVTSNGLRRAPATPERLVAPGQMASHYAPRGAVRLNATEKRDGEFHIGFGPVAGDVSLSPSGDLDEAARRLFAVLHDADAQGHGAIAVAPIPDEGVGRAINDRLRRAAAPRDQDVDRA